jgi:HPt (histidine-containing phosphotransfer) domain-containing protein
MVAHPEPSSVWQLIAFPVMRVARIAMVPVSCDKHPVYSALGADPDLGDLVDLFVEELPTRMQTALQIAEQSNWSELARFAHQLKGAAGGYGFHQITPYATRLEAAASDGSDDDLIRQTLSQLVELCQLCRTGAPA